MLLLSVLVTCGDAAANVVIIVLQLLDRGALVIIFLVILFFLVVGSDGSGTGTGTTFVAVVVDTDSADVDVDGLYDNDHSQLMRMVDEVYRHEHVDRNFLNLSDSTFELFGSVRLV